MEARAVGVVESFVEKPTGDRLDIGSACRSCRVCKGWRRGRQAWWRAF